MPKPDPNAALDAALARIAKLEHNSNIQFEINEAVANVLHEIRSELADLKSKKPKKT